MPVRRKLVRLAAGGSLVLMFGCTSFRSTVVENFGDETESKHLKGVPTTLTVPTHVRISLTQVRYANMTPGTDATPATPGVSTPLVNGKNFLATYEVDYRFIEQKQLHTVDFKRPFSGTLSTKLGFNKDKQVITSIENKVVDTTITDVTALITTVMTKLPGLKKSAASATSASVTTSPNVFRFTDVVGEAIFDVHDPSLEQHIQEFLQSRLNACTPPCSGQACP